MAHKIIISNQKGGVGKTTTTLEIAATLTKKRKKVLVIDFDGQINITKYLNINFEGLIRGGGIPTIRDIMLELQRVLIQQKTEETKEEELEEIERFILSAVQKNAEGIFAISGDRKLSKADGDFLEYIDLNVFDTLLSLFEDDYDYILIDTSPARSCLLTMGYTACDFCIAVADSDPEAKSGVGQLITDIDILKSMNKTDIKLLGIIFNRNEDANVQIEAYFDLKEFEKEGENLVFNTAISKGNYVLYAKREKKSIHEYYKHANAKEKKGLKQVVSDYDNLVKEILERIG